MYVHSTMIGVDAYSSIAKTIARTIAKTTATTTTKTIAKTLTWKIEQLDLVKKDKKDKITEAEISLLSLLNLLFFTNYKCSIFYGKFFAIRCRHEFCSSQHVRIKERCVD